VTGSESTARPSWPRLRSLVEPALVVVTVAALVLGGVARLIGWRAVADGCWVAGTLAAVVPAVVWVVVSLRRGRAGVDLLAVLSLVGTLWVGEYVAGALIAVMLSTGRALDAAAQRRASHDLRALLERAPRFARRRVGDAVTVVPLGEVAVGSGLVVGPGEVVPVDYKYGLGYLRTPTWRGRDTGGAPDNRGSPTRVLGRRGVTGRCIASFAPNQFRRRAFHRNRLCLSARCVCADGPAAESAATTSGPLGVGSSDCRCRAWRQCRSIKNRSTFCIACPSMS
jgi:hypothetical protein